MWRRNVKNEPSTLAKILVWLDPTSYGVEEFKSLKDQYLTVVWHRDLYIWLDRLNSFNFKKNNLCFIIIIIIIIQWTEILGRTKFELIFIKKNSSFKLFTAILTYLMSPCIINLYFLLPEDTLYWFTLNEILLKPNELRRCRTSQSKYISWCLRACDGNFFYNCQFTHKSVKTFKPLWLTPDQYTEWYH